jgi:hypothetical protein
MLLRLPPTWPTPVIAALAMTVLAVLDLAGSIAAKEAVVRRSPMIGLGGAAIFLVLFWIYASSLQYAELAPVTVGWVVMLQIGVVLVDHLRYGTPVSTWKGAAVVVIVVAQGFLLLAPDGPTAHTAAHVMNRSSGAHRVATLGVVS